MVRQLNSCGERSDVQPRSHAVLSGYLSHIFPPSRIRDVTQYRVEHAQAIAVPKVLDRGGNRRPSNVETLQCLQ